MLKIGDRFARLSDFETAIGRNFPGGFQKKSFIKDLPGHPDVSCSRLVFYNKNFPDSENNSWWNEFEGVDRTTTAANWKNLQWLCSDKTSVVHEIHSPLSVPMKPGAVQRTGEYHPVGIISECKTKRLILGNFRYKRENNFVFLGVYELDKDASFAFPDVPYKVDVDSFPSNAIVDAMRANPDFPQSHIIAKQNFQITYPHCVWRRVADTWKV